MNVLQKRLLCAFALLVGTTAAHAQSLVASNTNAGTNTTNQPSTVTYTPGADSGSFDFQLSYNPAILSTTTAEVTGTIPNGTLACNVPAAGTILCSATANSAAVDLGGGTITILFDVGATVGSTPLTFTSANFFSQLGGTEPGTTTNGSVNVQAVSGPTVAYTPATGPLTFGPGGAGQAATPIPITIDGTGGTAGQSTTVNCAFSPAVTGLSVTGGPFTINGPASAGTDGTFNVGCTYQAGTPLTGNLQCTATPTTGSPVVTTYAVNCPAGGATPPTIAYNPNFGTTIQFNGAGAPISQNITVTQTANGQANTSVSVGTCTVPAGFTTTTTPNPIVFTGGQANAGGTINVTCTTQNSTGTLSCPETTNNGTGPVTVQRTWQLNCPNPSPEIVTNPASGSTVSLAGAPGSTVSGSVGVQNTGFAPLTVTGCTITGAGAASFTTPVVSGGGTIAAGGTGTISFSCTTPGTGGQSVAASLSCTTNDADEGTITFPLACTAILLSIPTLGLMGKGLMALLVLGLGLVGFRLHRRFA